MQWAPKGHVGVHSVSTPSTSRGIDQRVPRCMQRCKQMMIDLPKGHVGVHLVSTPSTSRRIDNRVSRCMAIYKQICSTLGESYKSRHQGWVRKSIPLMTVDVYRNNSGLIKVIYGVSCLFFDESGKSNVHLRVWNKNPKDHCKVGYKLRKVGIHLGYYGKILWNW